MNGEGAWCSAKRWVYDCHWLCAVFMWTPGARSRDIHWLTTVAVNCNCKLYMLFCCCIFVLYLFWPDSFNHLLLFLVQFTCNMLTGSNGSFQTSSLEHHQNKYYTMAIPIVCVCINKRIRTQQGQLNCCSIVLFCILLCFGRNDTVYVFAIHCANFWLIAKIPHSWRIQCMGQSGDDGMRIIQWIIDWMEASQ